MSPLSLWARSSFRFLEMHLFYQFSVSIHRPHGDGVLGHGKRSFSKTLTRVDLFKNAVFLFSCGRVKMELFKKADVTASIYDASEHTHGSLEIAQGYFNCVFPLVEVRAAKLECNNVFTCLRVDGDIFENAPHVDADNFVNG